MGCRVSLRDLAFSTHSHRSFRSSLDNSQLRHFYPRSQMDFRCQQKKNSKSMALGSREFPIWYLILISYFLASFQDESYERGKSGWPQEGMVPSAPPASASHQQTLYDSFTSSNICSLKPSPFCSRKGFPLSYSLSHLQPKASLHPLTTSTCLWPLKASNDPPSPLFSFHPPIQHMEDAIYKPLGAVLWVLPTGRPVGHRHAMAAGSLVFFSDINNP